MEKLFKYLSFSKEQENLKENSSNRLEVFITASNIYIKTFRNQHRTIRIHRVTNTKEFVQQKTETNSNTRKYLFQALFGQIDIFNQKMLIFVTESLLIGEFCNTKVFQVQNVDFLPISQNLNPHLYEQTEQIVQGIKKYLKTGFYYSDSISILNNLQKSNVGIQNLQDLKGNCFAWNLGTFLRFSQDQNFIEFFTPFFQGFFGQIKNDQFKFTLISRRSFYQGGTRYNNRGIDVFGNVANFVEIEQIVEQNSMVSSYIQIRGSLPFFWEQNGIQAKVEIHQSHKANLKAFGQNMEKVLGDYMKIYFINLLSENKKQEKKLSHFQQKLLQDLQEEIWRKVDYQQIDFHALVQETDFTKINPFVQAIVNQNDFSILVHNFIDEKYEKAQEQKLVIRTNCLDCLDRTNAFQTKVSLLNLHYTLQYLQIKLVDNIFYEQDIISLYEKSNSNFIAQFKSLWADNGDNISKIYAGTGATTSSVTRGAQKKSLFSIIDHGVKTLSRFYVNNFEDDFKQKIYHFVVDQTQSKPLGSKYDLKIKVVNIYDNLDEAFFQLNVQDLLNSIENPYSDFVLINLFKKEQKKIQLKNTQIKESRYLLSILKHIDIINANYSIQGHITHLDSQIVLLRKLSSQNQVDFFKENLYKGKGHQNYSINISLVIGNISVQFLISNFKNLEQIDSVFQEVFASLKLQRIDVVYFIDKNVNDFQIQKYVRDFTETQDAQRKSQTIKTFVTNNHLENNIKGNVSNFNTFNTQDTFVNSQLLTLKNHDQSQPSAENFFIQVCF